jgi:hypothetical protein
LEIEMAQVLLALISLILAALISLLLFRVAVPVVHIRITPSWAGDAKEVLIVKYEVENKSRVRLKNPTVRLQVIDHALRKDAPVSDWVPFDTQDIGSAEELLSSREAISVFPTTRKIYPQELISGESLFYYLEDSIIVQIALQVTARLNPLARLSARHPWSQTAWSLAVKGRIS